MKATFETAIILGYLHAMTFRYEKNGWAAFRPLQNFLLECPDWKTCKDFTLHFGEQGETGTLQQLLGKRHCKILDNIREKFSDRAHEEQARSRKYLGGSIFGPENSKLRRVKEFLAQVEYALGKNVVLDHNNKEIAWF